MHIKQIQLKVKNTINMFYKNKRLAKYLKGQKKLCTLQDIRDHTVTAVTGPCIFLMKKNCFNLNTIKWFW